MFNFIVKHMPRKKHTTADGLFQRDATPKKIEQKAEEENINNFIEAQLESLWVFFFPNRDFFSFNISKRS